MPHFALTMGRHTKAAYTLTHHKKAGVRRKPAKKGKRAKYDMRFAFQTPTRVQIVGMSGSGKTEWVVKYLNTYGRRQFDFVLVVTQERSADQRAYKKLERKWGEYMEIVIGLDRDRIDEVLRYGKEQGWSVCVLIDDLIMESKNKYLQELFVSARQDGATVIELLQSVFPEGSRLHRLQTPYYVLFNFPAKDEAKRLFQQCTTSKEAAAALTNAYRKIISSRKHAAMIYDLNDFGDPNLPLRVRHTEMDHLVPALATT